MARRKERRGFRLVNAVGGTAAGGGGVDGILEGGADNFESPAVNNSTTRGTTLTAGSANTKGSFVELDASTAFAAIGVIVYAQDFSASNQRHLIDIATGAAASETVVIPNVFYGSPSTSSASHPAPVFLPIAVAAGARISARTQSEDGSATIDVSITLVGSTTSTATPSALIRDYGPDTSTTLLPSRDFGSAGSETVHVKSAWTEITAATTAAHEFIAIVFGGFNNGSATRQFLVDIGTGGAGSEVVLLPDMLVSVDHATDRITAYVGPLPVTIASGTRLSFRAQADNVETSFNIIDVAVYGL